MNPDAETQITGALLLVAVLAISIGATGTILLCQPVMQKIPIVDVEIQKEATTVSLFHKAGDALTRGKFRILADGTDITPSCSKQGGQNWNSWKVGETLECQGSPSGPAPQRVTVEYTCGYMHFLLAARG